jgi:hypothetical protein
MYRAKIRKECIISFLSLSRLFFSLRLFFILKVYIIVASHLVCPLCSYKKLPRIKYERIIIIKGTERELLFRVRGERKHR